MAVLGRVQLRGPGGEPVDLARRFARYGRRRGLAWWCVLTRDWLPVTPQADR